MLTYWETSLLLPYKRLLLIQRHSELLQKWICSIVWFSKNYQFTMQWRSSRGQFIHQCFSAAGIRWVTNTSGEKENGTIFSSTMPETALLPNGKLIGLKVACSNFAARSCIKIIRVLRSSDGIRIHCLRWNICKNKEKKLSNSQDINGKNAAQQSLEYCKYC